MDVAAAMGFSTEYHPDADNRSALSCIAEASPRDLLAASQSIEVWEHENRCLRAYAPKRRHSLR